MLKAAGGATHISIVCSEPFREGTCRAAMQVKIESTLSNASPDHLVYSVAPEMVALVIILFKRRQLVGRKAHPNPFKVELRS